MKAGHTKKQLSLSFWTLVCSFLIFSISTCSTKTGVEDWQRAIPDSTPLIQLHHGHDLFTVLEKQKTLLLQELSDVRLEALGDLKKHAAGSLPVKGIALFPSGSHQLIPVFILQKEVHGIGALSEPFQKDFAQNSYQFQNHLIHIFHFNHQKFYGTELRDWMVISPNSAAIENSILSFFGENHLFSYTRQSLSQGDYLLNTPMLEKWIKNLAAPRYLPKFKDMFLGTEAALLKIQHYDYDDPLYNGSLTATIPISDNFENTAPLVKAFSSQPASFDLERYIPSDAHFFAFYQQESEQEIPYLKGETTEGHPQSKPAASTNRTKSMQNRLDSLLVLDKEKYQKVAATLASQAAVAAFEASGFLSLGEHMYVRKLEDRSGFNEILQKWQRERLIKRSNNIYHIESEWVARLIAGPFTSFMDFYLIQLGNAVVMTGRSGLARRIAQDYRRRAVYHYDDRYMSLRSRHPKDLSAWIYFQSDALLSYLEPRLNPVNHAAFLSTLTDISTVSLVRKEMNCSFRMDNYYGEERTEPVRDRWVHGLDGAALTGSPVFSQIFGTSRKEMFFSTDNHTVWGVASDGSGFLQINTGDDSPVGSPVIYDWYANNQYAIMTVAGNSIYAWNTRGNLLPGFPVTLEEKITTPLLLADVSRNGQPEMVVATADRKVHVMDQRGDNIEGWPQDLNTVVTHQPLFKKLDGEYSLWVTAGNGLFAFSENGSRRPHFPLFIESDFGPISIYRQHILAGASDGHLYAIGKQPFFADSLVVPLEKDHLNDEQTTNASEISDSINDSSVEKTNHESKNEDGSSGALSIRRIYVSNTPILNAPIVQSLSLRAGAFSDHHNTNGTQSDRVIRKTLIGVQNLNGSLFLFSEAGQLRLTKNMGEPAAGYDNMMITDINGDGKKELIGIGRSGRLYAWQIDSGERLNYIPPVSMRFPVIEDIMGNGEIELVGQTRDGLRCWSFRRP